MSSRPAVSVVAPCFNEEAVLPEFVRRVLETCRGLGEPFEVVLVNDGSRDGTWRRMRELSAANRELVCVNLSRNHGHQLALTAGLSMARGERVLVIDADLQDPPELLPRMMALMDEADADGRRPEVVYAVRTAREGETAFKRATAAAFYRLIQRLTDVPIPADTGDFRLLSRRALEVLLAMPERHRFVRGMVSWIGFRQVPVEYKRDPRLAGETHYTLRKMLRFAVDAVTSFSIRPLTFARTLGLVTAGLALVLFVYSIVSWLVFQTAPGWTSIMAGVALLGGVQLLVLGIIGEYLGRLYDQSKGRPLFIIESVLRAEDPDEAGGPSLEVRVPRRAAGVTDGR